MRDRISSNPSEGVPIVLAAADLPSLANESESLSLGESERDRTLVAREAKVRELDVSGDLSAVGDLVFRAPGAMRVEWFCAC